MRPEFFEIMEFAQNLGFTWGMTSNGTLIDKETARKLRKTGLRTVSISVDGLKENHEWFRQSPGCYEKSIEAVKALESQEAQDFLARRLYDMTGEIIMSLLLLHDATLAPELFADSARVYVRMAEENVIGKAAYIEKFSVEDLSSFRAVKE